MAYLLGTYHSFGDLDYVGYYMVVIINSVNFCFIMVNLELLVLVLFTLAVIEKVC